MVLTVGFSTLPLLSCVVTKKRRLEPAVFWDQWTVNAFAEYHLKSNG